LVDHGILYIDNLNDQSKHKHQSIGTVMVINGNKEKNTISLLYQ